MTTVEKLIENISASPAPIIEEGLNPLSFTRLNLSVENQDLKRIDITDPAQCQTYIDEVLHRSKAQMAFGGYLERRNLYDNSPNFTHNSLENRNIHLGIDIWAPAGTTVLTPSEGVIHSFTDNKGPGNYGPTVILEHNIGELRFYTLYGHLSRHSLEDFRLNRPYLRGESLAQLGNPEENGHYAPHLHFQIILDLEGFEGDYPGVCCASDLEHFKKNCPNPNLLLKIKA